MDAIRAVFFTLYHSRFNFPSMSYFYGKFVLIHVIIVIHHTTPFTWAITLTHVNWYHFPIIPIVTKMVIVSILCLTHVILFILIYVLGPFSSRTTFNDSYLVQFCIIFDQNARRVTDSPLSNIISFFKDIPNGRMGWS